MKKSAKIVIFNSVIAIVMCFVLICGATTAIFTSTSTTNIAITSGTVNVVATPSLISATYASWNELTHSYDYPSCDVSGNTANFINGGSASIDGADVKLQNITAGDSATVQIAIKNYSTIDIKYQLTATFGDDIGFLNVLDIDLTCDNRELEIFDETFSHSTTSVGPDKASKWQLLSASAGDMQPAIATLNLTISFPMSYSLDMATYSGKSASITLAVKAVQGNSPTEDPKAPETHEVVPTGTSYTVSAADEGQYKILTAQQVDGYEFLYWAYKKDASKSIARIASTTDYGEYLTGSPVYKFRVTPDTYGTYQAVYRNVNQTSKTVRLSKANPYYTVQQNDVGSEITLIAAEETGDIYDRFTKTQNNNVQDININGLPVYTFTPDNNDVGAVYQAHYVQLDMEEYFDYFDNMGSVNYNAYIVNPNVPRPTQVKEGSGGIDGEFTAGEFAAAQDASGKSWFTSDELYQISDYPIYNKGYKTNVDRVKNNTAVIAEGDALSGIGSRYFMDEEGNLLEYTITDIYELSELYDQLADLWCAEKGYPQGSCREGNPSFAQEYADQFCEEVMNDAYQDLIIWKPVGYLYKHTMAENLYLGNVDPNQPAVEKVISATPYGSNRNNSPMITGLYAPAGEVITFKISKQDMERTGGMIITIGQVQMNGYRRALDTKDNNPLRPHFLTTQITLTPKTEYPSWSNTVDENGDYTFYFGSYIGGPIYVSSYNGGEPFTITISGAVEYQHYIYGYTTPQEFNERAEYLTTVPYFDLYIPTENVQFSGPSVYAKDLDWANFTKVSRLWEQIARISKQFPGDNFTDYGVMFNYDLYITAGACAFTAINTVNAHHSWMRAALNYDGIVKNGDWGNFHEFNHCYQLFGWRDPEVANNAVNLVEFAMLTDVSANRLRDENGMFAGVSGWSSYTDPAYALLVSLDPDNTMGLLNGSRDYKLCRYVNMFYGFGIDRFIDGMQRTANYSYTNENIARGASEGAGYNMQYYFNNVIGKNGTLKLNLPGYPMFVPVASPYQTGIGHAYDPNTGIGVDATTYTGDVTWEYSHSSSPYRIDMTKPFTLDFENTFVIPGRTKGADGKWTDGQFDWSIKCTSQPTYGTLQDSGDNGRHFVYYPDQNAINAGTSGSMIFTVTYVGKTGTVAEGISGSVQIVVQFDQKTGTVPDYSCLDRTVYTFSSENGGKDTDGSEEETVAAAAVDESKLTSEELFAAAQQTWLKDIEATVNGDKDYKFKYFDGTFDDAMYITTEKNSLPQGVETQNNTAVYFDNELNCAPANSFVVVNGMVTPTNDGTYYLGIESYGNSALYISTDGTNYQLFVACGNGVANASGTVMQGGDGEPYRATKQIVLTAGETVYFREVLAPNADDPNGDHVKMLWGKTSDSLTDQLDNPNDPNHVGCAYCLRQIAAEPYELEYWTVHEETYFDPISVKQTLVDAEEDVLKGLTIPAVIGFNGYDKEPLKLENFFSDNPYDFLAVDGINDSTPLKFTAQLDKEITADSFIIHALANYAPTKFNLYVGTSPSDLQLVYQRDVNGSINKNGTIQASFTDGPHTFSYYRLEIYHTVRSRNKDVYYLVINNIEFGTLWNVKQPSDRDVQKLGAWDNVRVSGATFGHLLTATGATESEPVATFTMKFTGTQLHIRALVGEQYGAVEILIDGNCVADIDLKAKQMRWVDILSDEFLSADALEKIALALSSGEEHTLVVRGVESFNIDAIYYR